MRNRNLALVAASSGLMAACLSVSALAAGQASGTSAAPQAAQAPQIAEIDNVLLYRRLSRLGMVTQTLGYSLDVSAEGQVTDCNLARKFRSPFTTKQICRALIDAVAFDPARDAQGMAVAGTFNGSLDLLTFFTPNR